MRYILIISIFFIGFECFAQQVTNKEDVVTLLDGSVIRGQILEYRPDNLIKIKIFGGSVLVYDANEVLSIKKEASKAPFPPTLKEYRQQKHWDIPEKSFFWQQLSAKCMVGRANPWRAFTTAWGGGIDYTIGHQFSQYSGVGIGTGFERHHFFNVIPLFLTYRGYFMDKSESLYYNLSLGYSLIMRGGTWRHNVTHTSSGFYAYPSIGYRFKSKRKTHLTIEFGLTVQGLNNTPIYDWDSDWNPGISNPTIRNYTVLLYKPTLKIGYIL